MLKQIILIAITIYPLKPLFSQINEVAFNPATYVILDSITIANGSKISKEEFIKACDIAWKASFGKLNNEEKKLLEGVQIGVAIPNEEDAVEQENN